VIGGGIVGCATAYYLARRRARVTLLEKDGVADEQSSRAWGFVRKQGRHPAEVPLMIASSEIWGGLARELEAEVDFVRGGNLALAETPADLERLEDVHAADRKTGLNTRLVLARELGALVKGLEGSWAGGLYSPDDGHAEPRKATEAFARAARRAGARIETGCAAVGLDLCGGRVAAVLTERGRVRTGGVVCAAGIWSPLVARWAGLSLPCQVVATSVAATEPVEPVSTAGVWGPYVAFRQTPSGAVYIGDGYRGAGSEHYVTLDSFRHLRLFWRNFLMNREDLHLHVGRSLAVDVWRVLTGTRGIRRREHEPEPVANQIAFNLRHLRATVPALARAAVTRTWAGYIDLSPDLIPVIGAVERPAGFYLAAGFSGHGFAMGPVVGQLLADAILGPGPSLDLRPFRFSRFAERDLAPARHAF
ncbi:MAG: FAD-binding oxidoreductase, partial [Candidatus Rokubacteria bacterium]|nr:FAD-binding oxidoreductase [Candidatus Rokubacteria bacterium]